MRQRYIISKKGSANDLTIKEYAAIGNYTGKQIGTMPVEEEYALLCQEQYRGKDIQPSILMGMDGLIAMLRTNNLFPVGPLAAKIAEIVTALYRSPDDGSAELVFDDMELLDFSG